MKPGRNLKLADSWEGPYMVMKRNSPLSYVINPGDRQIPSVHVQLMKKHQRDKDKVSRITSVLEGDTCTDEIVTRYAETKVTQDQLEPNQTAEIDKLLGKYEDVLTTEPGLTELTEFAIDTGKTEPIFQRAYNMPASLKDSIDTEIQ